MSVIDVDVLPFRLLAEGPPAPRPPEVAEGLLRLTAGPGADLFLDPRGTASAPDAQRWVGEVSGDFQFSALTTARFTAAFDSAALLGWVDERTWFKVCAELDPEGTPRVVSVVTRGTSDDVNSWPIDPAGVHLRISRVGQAFALHASPDAESWDMVRVFDLGVGAETPIRLGFLAQSPTGEGTEAVFSEIRFEHETLQELRDGS